MSTILIKPSSWETVMSAFTGLRLAIYDDALTTGRADPRTAEQVEAARWLRYHRMAVIDDLDGYLRSRPLPMAREVWERFGPDNSAALPEAPRSPLAAAPVSPAPEPVRVSHPSELLALDF